MKSTTRARSSKKPSPKRVIYTIGHSTHPIREFIDILQRNQIKQLIDVRTIPKSRFNPQFSKDRLKASLRKAGIKYIHFPELGGLRHAKPDSVNPGWRNASFRGYADYMQTRPFAGGIRRLIQASKSKATAILCAEALPWRCHRSLIADALGVRGIEIEHLMGDSKRMPHTMTRFARVKGWKITYPLESPFPASL